MGEIFTLSHPLLSPHTSKHGENGEKVKFLAVWFEVASRRPPRVSPERAGDVMHTNNLDCSMMMRPLFRFLRMYTHLFT